MNDRIPIASLKIKALSGLLAFALSIFGAAVLADGLAGGGPEISWYTIDGGGGTSQAGAYSLSGTIGQPDAGGPMAGGAYSLTGGFWPGATPVEDCPADITNDETVGVADLLAVISAWGACSLPCPPACAADISPIPAGDCAVGVADLLLVIASWGACP